MTTLELKKWLKTNLIELDGGTFYLKNGGEISCIYRLIEYAERNKNLQ